MTEFRSSPRRPLPPGSGLLPVVMNADVLLSPLTGVPRYVREIIPFLETWVEPLVPRLPVRRARGRRFLWEQFCLPRRLSGRLLWSPASTGPLSVRRQVVTLHDLAVLDHPEWFNSNLVRWFRYLLPRLLPKVSHVIAVSEFTRSRALALTSVAPERVSTVLHGIPARFAPQTAEAIRRVRQALQLPDRPYLLFLGTLEPRKNLPGLLAAWAAARSAAPEAVLVVAGQEGRSSVFASHGIRALPEAAIFLGRVPDEHLPGLYAGALAVAYLSHYEGFGFPPLEAMRCGAPVLASTTTAVGEVVGAAALTVCPDDAAAVASGLRQILTDRELRRRLIAAGLQHASRFTWERAAAATGEILRSCSQCAPSREAFPAELS